MSYFTPNDQRYLKDCVARIERAAYYAGFQAGVGADIANLKTACQDEIARLVAFIDGCTLEGQGHD